MKPLYYAVHKVTKKCTKKQSSSLLELRMNWTLIIGKILSRKTYPQKVTYDYKAQHAEGEKAYLLHLDVEPSWALEVQHEQTAICHKINSFFGKPLFTRLKIRQACIQVKKSLPKVKPPLTASKAQKIKESLRHVENEELSIKLEKLGRAIYAESE